MAQLKKFRIKDELNDGKFVNAMMGATLITSIRFFATLHKEFRELYHQMIFAGMMQGMTNTNEKSGRVAWGSSHDMLFDWYKQASPMVPGPTVPGVYRKIKKKTVTKGSRKE